MKLLQKIGAFSLALGLLFGLALTVQGNAKAASQDVNLQLALTTSVDNGQTWGSDNRCVKPGDTVQIRTRIWNEGSDDVVQVFGDSEATNSQYLADCTPTNPNEDNDNYAYTQNPLTDDGDIHVHSLAANSSETTGYQGSIVTCRIPPEVPCDTEIRGTVMLTRYSNDQGSQEDRQVFNLIKKALAGPTFAEQKFFTLSVNRDTCPRVCGSSTKKTTTLPETGSSIIDLANSLF